MPEPKKLDAEIPASLPVTTTLDVCIEMSPPNHVETEIPAPADPETSPLESMVTDPVPYVATRIPLAPETLATLTVTLALLMTRGPRKRPAWIARPVPDALSIFPVVVTSMSPLAELFALIAAPLCVDTVLADIEMTCEPVPMTDVEIPASLPVTATSDVSTKTPPPCPARTAIAVPADPETSPVASIVAEPVPYDLT